MRILLQQKDSGRYLKAAGDWTTNAGEAMDFLCSTKVIDYCAVHHLNNVQIVLKFDEQLYDIVLPVMADQPAANARSR